MNFNKILYGMVLCTQLIVASDNRVNEFRESFSDISFDGGSNYSLRGSLSSFSLSDDEVPQGVPFRRLPESLLRAIQMRKLQEDLLRAVQAGRVPSLTPPSTPPPLPDGRA